MPIVQISNSNDTLVIAVKSEAKNFLACPQACSSTFLKIRTLTTTEYFPQVL